MKDCPFINDIVTAKLDMVSDEEYNSLIQQYMDTESALEDIKKLSQEEDDIVKCRTYINDVITREYNYKANILNRNLYKFYPQINRYNGNYIRRPYRVSGWYCSLPVQANACEARYY